MEAEEEEDSESGSPAESDEDWIARHMAEQKDKLGEEFGEDLNIEF